MSSNNKESTSNNKETPSNNKESTSNNKKADTECNTTSTNPTDTNSCTNTKKCTLCPIIVDDGSNDDPRVWRTRPIKLISSGKSYVFGHCTCTFSGSIALPVAHAIYPGQSSTDRTIFLPGCLSKLDRETGDSVFQEKYGKPGKCECCICIKRY
jgi:hypothetical protein